MAHAVDLIAIAYGIRIVLWLRDREGTVMGGPKELKSLLRNGCGTGARR